MDRSAHSPPDREPPGAEWPQGGRWLLLAACVLALVRFLRLGEWSLWFDEALTWADYHHALASEGITNPLGYRLIGWTAGLLGGADELTLRFLPCLAGVLCVPLAHWAFRPLLGSRRAAFVALLLAVSAWHVYWSQCARFYTLAQLCSLLGTGFFLRGLWPARAGRGLALALFGLLVAGSAAAFHPTAGLLVPALVVGALAAVCTRDRSAPHARVVWPLVGIVLVLALCALPWVLGVLGQHEANKPPRSGGPLHLVLTAGYFFTPVLLCGALAGLWRGRHSPPAAWLLASGVTLCTAALVLCLSLRMQMTAQYVFCLLPWVAALASLALDGSAAWQARRWEPVYVLVLTLAGLGGTALYLTARAGERPRWREAYEYVAGERESGDMILGMASNVGEFYLSEGYTDLRRPRVVEPLDRYHTRIPVDWNRLDRRIWVVVRPQWLEDLRAGDREPVERWLRESCRLRQRFPVLMDGRDLELLVYLKE